MVGFFTAESKDERILNVGQCYEILDIGQIHKVNYIDITVDNCAAFFAFKVCMPNVTYCFLLLEL